MENHTVPRSRRALRTASLVLVAYSALYGGTFIVLTVIGCGDRSMLGLGQYLAHNVVFLRLPLLLSLVVGIIGCARDAEWARATTVHFAAIIVPLLATGCSVLPCKAINLMVTVNTNMLTTR